MPVLHSVSIYQILAENKISGGDIGFGSEESSADLQFTFDIDKLKAIQMFHREKRRAKITIMFRK